MPNTAIDPLGHLKLSVSNLEKSKKFYNEILTKIGFKKIVDEDGGIGWERS